ncbi:MAG: hypothetical protein ACKO56_13695, partial [Paracoccaceae bacterium]
VSHPVGWGFNLDLCLKVYLKNLCVNEFPTAGWPGRKETPWRRKTLKLKQILQMPLWIGAGTWRRRRQRWTRPSWNLP